MLILFLNRFTNFLVLSWNYFFEPILFNCTLTKYCRFVQGLCCSNFLLHDFSTGFSQNQDSIEMVIKTFNQGLILSQP